MGTGFLQLDGCKIGLQIFCEFLWCKIGTSSSVMYCGLQCFCKVGYYQVQSKWCWSVLTCMNVKDLAGCLKMYGGMSHPWTVKFPERKAKFFG